MFRYHKSGACSLSQFLPDRPLKLGDARLIINPGGVGQPRDGNPRASYAIYDSQTREVTLRRVAYDISATQAKMMAHHLPPRLAARLSYGL